MYNLQDISDIVTNHDKKIITSRHFRQKVTRSALA